MVVKIGDRGDGGEGVCAYIFTYFDGFLNC